MSIQIRTETYEFAHGCKPKGRGSWAFIRTASHGLDEQTIFAPSNITFREACAWVRQTLRRDGWQDATVHVGS